MPAIAALAYHRASGRNISQPNQRMSYSENFLYMLDAANKPGYKPNPRLARAMDIMFTLHAEHEMNCSTAAARHLASSGVDVYTAIAGAWGAPPLVALSCPALCRLLPFQMQAVLTSSESCEHGPASSSTGSIGSSCTQWPP